MARHVFLFALILSALGVCNAQALKAKKRAVGDPTSLEPYAPAKDYAPKIKASRKDITYNSEVKDFYKRKKKVEHYREKIQRELEKPQYSDPTYFGHKRPPKKHPPGKMKFCKICGIRH